MEKINDGKNFIGLLLTKALENHRNNDTFHSKQININDSCFKKMVTTKKRSKG